MANKNICTSCLRALRQQPRTYQTRPTSLSRTTLSQQRIQQPFQERTYANKSPSSGFSPSTEAPPRPKDYDSPTASPDALTNLAAKLRSSNALRSTTEPYVAYGGTEDLFLECSRQCSYTIPSALSTPPAPPPMNAAGDHLGEGSGFWLTPKSKGGLGLDATFQSWAQVLYLHLWMLTARFRCFPRAYVQDWHQHLLDHFFYAAEDRMATWHGMSSRAVRNKNLKDQWQIWRGAQLGYDEGLIRGDAAMGAAVWRSIFKSDPEVDVGDVALVTAYVMRELQRLGNLQDHEVTEGKVKFGTPSTLQNVLSTHSSWMRQPVKESELVGAQ